MKLAYTMSEERGQIDRILADLAARMIAEGVNLSGVVQTNSGNCDHNHCDMDVQVLPDGAIFRISQSLGKEAKGCRLDPGALEKAVGAVAGTLSEDTALLIVNKFGKHEAEGRGFRPVIAEALARDIPVLLGVSKLSLAAFRDFAGDAAEFVEAEDGALLDWIRVACAEQPCARAGNEATAE